MTDSKLRVFVSSPADVAEERDHVSRVAHRLAAEFDGLQIEVVRWEESWYSAATGFQEQIPAPDQCDLVVVIVWKRLGSPLPDDFARPDGTQRTGTEYEFEVAMGRALEAEIPDILVYRKTEKILFEAERVDQEKAELQALEAFWRRWIRNEKGHFTGAFKAFESADQFGDRLESDLRAWLKDRQREVSWPASKGSPFRGLEAFESRHARVFFGRDRAARELRARLLANANEEAVNNFLVVVGASGSGKSSLARAGLIPGLEQQDHIGDSMLITPSQLGETPLQGLARALFAALPELAQSDCRSPDELAEHFLTAPTRAARPLEGAIERGATRPGRWLLLLDQLEEIFQWPACIREAFLAVVQGLAQSAYLWVVATLRSDAYPQLIAEPMLKALSADQRQYNLAPIREWELRKVIRGPARAAGLAFERREDGTGLDQVLLDEAQAEANVLPLLEFTLEQLFQERDRDTQTLTFAAYEALGGLRLAIGRLAESALQGGAQGSREFPTVIRKLVALDDDGQATRRRAALDEFESSERPLVDALVEARLLVTEGDDRPSVLLAHEALLTHWERVQQWLCEDRDFLRWQARIRREAGLWHEERCPRARLLQPGKPLSEAESWLGARPETIDSPVQAFIRASICNVRRQRRRMGLAAGGVFIALALLSGAALWQAQQARAERDRAEANAAWVLEVLKATISEVAAGISLAITDIEGVHQSVLQKKLLVRVTERVHDLWRGFAKRNDKFEGQRLLQRALGASGGALKNAGVLEEALAAYEERVTIVRQLFERDPTETQWQEALLSSLASVADTRFRLGNLEEALSAHEERLTFARRLVEQYPKKPEFQLAVSQSLQRIADSRREKGDLDGALAAYEKSLAIDWRLVERNPTITRWHRNLWVSWNKIGEVRAESRDLKGALVAFEEGLAIARRQTERHPTNARWQRDLSFSHLMVGAGAAMQGQRSRAISAFETALSILLRQRDRGILRSGDHKHIERARTALAELRGDNE